MRRSYLDPTEPQDVLALAPSPAVAVALMYRYESLHCTLYPDYFQNLIEI